MNILMLNNILSSVQYSIIKRIKLKQEHRTITTNIVNNNLMTIITLDSI